MERCPNCRLKCEEDAAFCPRCGLNLKEGLGTGLQSPAGNLPVHKMFPRSTFIGRWRVIVALAVVVLLLLFGGIWLLNRAQPVSQSTASKPHPRAPAQGMFWFYTSKAQNDSVALTLQHLPVLATDQQYVAWLSNPKRPNQYLEVSALKPDAVGNVSLRSEQIAGFNASASNLPVVYTKLLITRERSAVNLARPATSIILQGTLNTSASPEKQILLFGPPDQASSDSLIMDIQTRIQRLLQRMQDLENAQKKHDITGAERQSRRILYLLEGKAGVDIARLNLVNSNIFKKEGDGLAFSTPDCPAGQAACGALERLRTNIQGLTVAQGVPAKQQQDLLAMLASLTNLTGQARQQVLPLATEVTFSQADNDEIAKLRQTLQGLQSGRDLNGNGKIDPGPAEAGVMQFEQALQQVGAVKLTRVGA